MSRYVIAKLRGHTQLDLGETNALRVLQEATGSNFDLVTEWIIGTTNEDVRNLEAPSKQTILRLGDGLLKKGGYLYSLTVGVTSPYRKK